MKSHTADNFDWGSLQSFLAVVRTGRLTIAARQLGVDHSTLSRRIQKLEKNLQAHLFDRRAQGYALTAQGEHRLESSRSADCASPSPAPFA